MVEVVNILLAGVGGQGIVLASRVLADVALQSGKAVKVSETHGMAQRGGSVVTHVRFGEQVYSPLIALGQADFLLGFEKLEAMRFLPYLKKDGRLIVNDQEIYPLNVLLGKEKYPPEISSYLKEQTGQMCLVPAQEIAQQLGSPRVVNMVLLGVLAQFLDIPQEKWEEAIYRCVRPEFREINCQAFRKGFSWKSG
ncbi:MAG: Indolepyruvate ferredoxin oxidoreductase [Thermoanaerobacterales bacterium 50_218]|nr:MAG: Indolepyruvate ferredoxin oxidoreductase [Thermoanaerobacterales bacterium 50_218]HAA90324.1 indolepyruvate oxidoreductase subunit beta [Peptococcaceae bacterium]